MSAADKCVIQGSVFPNWGLKSKDTTQENRGIDNLDLSENRKQFTHKTFPMSQGEICLQFEGTLMTCIMSFEYTFTTTPTVFGELSSGSNKNNTSS